MHHIISTTAKDIAVLRSSVSVDYLASGDEDNNCSDTSLTSSSSSSIRSGSTSTAGMKRGASMTSENLLSKKVSKIDHITHPLDQEIEKKRIG